jgi:Concanavalin A-like lectin/glucanases superfamily
MKKIIFINLILLFSLNISHAQYTENYAASFNGSNSYISVPSSPGFSPTSAITLEAWVYPTQLLGTTMCIIGKNYQTGYFIGVQTSGRIVFYPKGGTFLRSKVAIL